MKTFGARKSSGFSWLILSAAFLAAWACSAKDVVVHAGTLDIDRAFDAAVFVREMLQQGIVYRRDGAPTTAQVN